MTDPRPHKYGVIVRHEDGWQIHSFVESSSELSGMESLEEDFKMHIMEYPSKRVMAIKVLADSGIIY